MPPVLPGAEPSTRLDTEEGVAVPLTEGARPARRCSVALLSCRDGGGCTGPAGTAAPSLPPPPPPSAIASRTGAICSSRDTESRTACRVSRAREAPPARRKRLLLIGGMPARPRAEPGPPASAPEPTEMVLPPPPTPPEYTDPPPSSSPSVAPRPRGCRSLLQVEAGEALPVEAAATEAPDCRQARDRYSEELDSGPMKEAER